MNAGNWTASFYPKKLCKTVPTAPYPGEQTHPEVAVAGGRICSLDDSFLLGLGSNFRTKRGTCLMRKMV